MKKRSPENPASPPESFDVWEKGAREFVHSRVWQWHGRTDLPLIPVLLMDVSRRDHRWFRHVNYPYMAVEMILQGEAEYRGEGEPAVRIGPGGYYAVTPGSSVRMVNSGHRVRRKLALILRGNCLSTLSAALGLSRDVYGQAADPAWLEKEILAFGEAMDSNADAEALSSRCYSFLLAFARMRAQEQRTSPQIAAALEYFQNHFREKVTIREAAAAQHCSEATLRRRFLAHCRMTPLRWLMELRLEYAARLLQSGNIPVKEISSRCGWSDGAGFAAAFRRKYGRTPAAYRKKGPLPSPAVQLQTGAGNDIL